MAGPFGRFGVGVDLPGEVAGRLLFPRSALADAFSIAADTAGKLSTAAREDRELSARYATKAKPITARARAISIMVKPAARRRGTPETDWMDAASFIGSPGV